MEIITTSIKEHYFQSILKLPCFLGSQIQKRKIYFEYTLQVCIVCPYYTCLCILQLLLMYIQNNCKLIDGRLITRIKSKI